MLTALKLEGLRFFPGARCQLADPSMLCRIGVVGHGGFSATDLRHLLQEKIARLWPNEANDSIPCNAWPQGFLAAPVAGLFPEKSSENSPDNSPNSELAAWIVALAVAIQRLARDPVALGQVVTVGHSQLLLAVPWGRQGVAKGALQFATGFVGQCISSQKPIHGELHEKFQQWLLATQGAGIAPNSFRFAWAARERGIPVTWQRSLLHLGWGARQRRMDSSFTDTTPVIATSLARNKFRTNLLLRESLIPVPQSFLTTNGQQAEDMLQKLPWPVVVKPNSQEQGLGVVTGIDSIDEFRRAWQQAATMGNSGVLVEQHIDGDDHRLLVVGGKLQVATRRIPGGVTGNGQASIAELVEGVNSDSRRGSDKRSLLVRLELDTEARSFLAQQGFDRDSVPAQGHFVPLRRTANISTGGTAEDVTAKIHPDNRLMAERAAAVIGLDIAGVDFICPDISRSWRECGGAVCEVNAQPGFRPHWLGDPQRDINGEIIDWMYSGEDGRIPTVAIVGARGADTVALLLHRIWQAAGVQSAVCTTRGLWIGNDQVSDADVAGFRGGRALLSDPGVEVAIMELPYRALQAFGHPCDWYDVSVLLDCDDNNSAARNANSVEQIARPDAEVLQRTRFAVVVNGDDPRCMALLDQAAAPRVIVVARNGDCPDLLGCRESGLEVVFLRHQQGQDWVVYGQGSQETPIVALADNGTGVQGADIGTDILCAVALAIAQGVNGDAIRNGLDVTDPPLTNG